MSQEELEFDSLGRLPERPVVVNDARESQPVFALRELWNYRDLLYFLTWRDIKVRYKQTAMGAAWAIVQPLFMMLIFAVFFGLFVGVPTDGMPHMLFFYCGLMPWTFFSGAVSNSSLSLVNSSNLITKIYFPRLIVPTASVGSGIVDLLITCAILIGIALFYGTPLSLNLLAFPLLILETLILATALGSWLAALTVRYRDIRHALPFVLQTWMFVTPIVYPLTVVPEKWRWLMYLNPLTGVVEGIRSSVMDRPFNGTAITVSVCVTLLVVIFATSGFRRLEKTFADLI